MKFTLTCDGRSVSITPRLPDPVAVSLSTALSYEPTGSEWAPNHVKNQFKTVDGKRVFNRAARWNGKVSLFKKGRVNENNRFPIGVLPQALQHLAKWQGYTWEVVKSLTPLAASKATLHGKCILLKGELVTVAIRDYQAETVAALLKHDQAMAEVATGGGKSVIMGEILIKLPGVKRLVTVPSKSLMYQTAADLEAMLGVPVGRWGDSKYDFQEVTVAIIDSVARGLKKPEIVAWLAGVQVWLCDESHLSATDKYKLVDEALCNTRRRYGVSATLIREDGAELVFHGMFGPCVIKFSAMELIRRGWLVKPRIEMHVVEQNYLHEGDSKKPTLDDVYAVDITYNLERNMQIGALVRRCYEEGRWPVLILVSDLAHGENLQDIISRLGPCGYLQGEDNQKTREKVLEQLKLGKLPFLVASTIFDIGVDIPCLRSVILAGCGKAQSRAVQRVGRGLRLDTTSLIAQLLGAKEEVLIIDFEDREKYFLRSHSLLRRSFYVKYYPGCVTTWKGNIKLQDFGDTL